MVALQLDYSVTRTFRWRWFAPMAYLGALVGIAFLVVINIALTGYETINIFNGDFNYTQTSPMLRFIPTRAHKAGTLCDSHLFNIGDSFVTNYAIFQWVIEAIDTPNAGDSGIDYKGTSLKDCDVTSVFLHGDIRTWSVDYTALISCNQTGVLEITAKASFSQSSLPGRRQAPLLGATQSSGDPRAKVLDRLSQIATVDIAQRLYSSMLLSNNTTPVILSLQADFEHCPASLGTSAPCANEVPKFNITYAATVFPDSRLVAHSSMEPTSKDNPEVIDSSTEGPLANLIQLMYASARIDLGNPSPNNFILNPAVSNQTLIQTFPRTPFISEVRADLFDQWTTHKGIENLDQYRPVTVDQPANIRVTYLCRSQRRKAIGPLFISVLVATLSMFSGGWAIFIFIATYFAKRYNDANLCGAHLADRSMSYHESPHDHALRRRVSDAKIYDGVAT